MVIEGEGGALIARLLKLNRSGPSLPIAKGRKGVGPPGTRHPALHPTTWLCLLGLPTQVGPCLLGCNVSAPLLPPSPPVLRDLNPRSEWNPPLIKLTTRRPPCPSSCSPNLSPRFHPHGSRSYSRSRVGVVTGDTSFAITGSPLLPSVFLCCSCPVRRRCCWLNPSLCRVLLSCC